MRIVSSIRLVPVLVLFSVLGLLAACGAASSGSQATGGLGQASSGSSSAGVQTRYAFQRSLSAFASSLWKSSPIGAPTFGQDRAQVKPGSRVIEWAP